VSWEGCDHPPVIPFCGHVMITFQLQIIIAQQSQSDSLSEINAQLSTDKGQCS